VRHANVVATLDAGAADVEGQTFHYLVLEYVEGRTLRALLEEAGRLPEALVRHVGREAARALAAIHAAGAVHRDVKPENVLVTPDHAVKLTDLGVTRVVGASVRLSQTGTFVGSVLYAAPEQFGLLRATGAEKAIPRSPVRAKGDDIDARADLYALGLTLYEAATGTHPFAGEDFHVVLRRQIAETPRPAGEVNPQLSPLLEELLAQLLAKDPAARPASAAEVAEVLDLGEESRWWRERAAAIRRETRRPLRRIRIPRETAVYGREAELARLRSLYDRATAGDGQVVLLEGEAGIGKSRLMDEFVLSLWAAGEDIDFLCGSYPPGGAATASGAFSAAYREHLGDDEGAIRAALPQTPLLVSAFAALLRGDAAPENAEKLTKDSLQTVFVHATRSFAASRTTIVLIDDLHFAPEEGRALFAALALAVPGHRILLVGGARPGLPETWLAQIDRIGATRVALARLGTKDLVRLLADALRSTHLAEELAGKIGVKSDGNPFFVFEILRGLREGQFITKRSDGTWATTREIREIQVPSSVVELVQARVSGLGRADRDVLEVAACVGFEFDPALVGDVLGIAQIPLLQTLGAIEKTHRLVRSSGRRFVFDHHQVMEVLYASLSEPLREEYHAAIGTAMETRSGSASREPKDLDGALCVDLADHSLKGAQGARALRYLDAALTHLETSYLNDAAIGLADRALTAPGLLMGAARSKTLLRLARRFELLGRREPAREAIEKALAIAREIGDMCVEARATGDLGRVFAWCGDQARASEHYERQLAMAREIGDRQIEAYATGNLGNALRSLGRFAEALEYQLRKLALTREGGDRPDEAVATANLGNELRSLGRIAEAREQHERALALARELGVRWIEARTMELLGGDYWSLGCFAEAQELFEQSLKLTQQIGDRAGERDAAGSLGCFFGAVGRLEEARQHIERSLALAREIGDPRMVIASTVNLACALTSLGRHPEAREHAERGLALAREIGSRSLESFLLSALAVLADESGDVTLAERLLAGSLALRRAIGARADEAVSLCRHGALLLQTGRKDEACAEFEEALVVARELSLPGVELWVFTHLAALPGGDVEPALTALATYQERIEVKDRMEARFLLWTATHDCAHLAEAKRLLDYLVAHAPPDCRESMLTNVRLHREIVAAAREQGIP
jgi:tetratricopeptide (TPR) repeat protein